MCPQELSHFDCKLFSCIPKELFNYGYTCIYEELTVIACLWLCQTSADIDCMSNGWQHAFYFFVCIRFLYFSCSANTFLVRSSTAGYTQEKFRAFSKLWKGRHQTNTSAYNTVVIRICMIFTRTLLRVLCALTARKIYNVVFSCNYRFFNIKILNLINLYFLLYQDQISRL